MTRTTANAMATSDVTWHALSVDAAFDAARTGPDGLDDSEAQNRLAHYGPNRLAPPKPVSAWRILRDQLTGAGWWAHARRRCIASTVAAPAAAVP